MVREGALEELVSIEDQSEIVLEGASEELLSEVVKRAESEGAKVVRVGNPRTTLERLFLKETGGEK